MTCIRAFLHRSLPLVWQRRGLVARLLWPLSLLYGALWRNKKRLATNTPAAPLPIPVLVVGNVIAGGAGKTPTTIAVVNYFQALGVRTGIISRGYGRRFDAPACITVQANSSALDVGDEPLLMHRHTGVPVVVCAQRMQAAQALLQQYPNTQLLVCDDGLQHLALPRDGEICVMDERGIGNGWLLPAGPLREPWPRHSDLLLQTHTAPVSLTTTGYTPGLPREKNLFFAQRELASHAVQNSGQKMLLADWVTHKQPIHALAGIAQPERFFTMLRMAGLHVQSCHALPDHASPHSMLSLANTLLATGLPLLCTEKDAVKLWPTLPHIWAVPLQLEPESAFFAALKTWWQQVQHKRHQ